MDRKKLYKTIFALGLAFGVGAGSTYLINMKKINFMNRYPVMLEVEKFMEETLEVGKPPHDDEETVVNAYLALYDDKYTKYEAPVDIFAEDFIVKETNESSVALGSGFQIAFDDSDRLYISQITEGMAAAQQGLMAGDIIKSIDGNPVTEYKSAKKLRGEDGSTVALIIERNGTELEINFKRNCSTMAASKIERRMYSDTLYLRLGEIGMFMAEPLVQALEEDEFNSLVLDLRGNGGGFTDIAVSFADLFIGAADVTMHAKSGSVETMSTTDSITYDIPIVILVDGSTASAAEIITSLLKQYADATIVGTQTFGKGIYQIEAFFKGGTLTYTDGYVTVGDWECYHGIGIKPDIEMPLDSKFYYTDEDEQLNKALELLN